MRRRQRQQRQQQPRRRRLGGIGRIGQGFRQPGARVLLTALATLTSVTTLTGLCALWAVASPAEDRFAQSGIQAVERRGLRGDEEGLRNDEILGARAVSRSLFAAQRAERSEAEAVGLTRLVPALRRVEQTLQRLRAVELEAAMPRVRSASDGEASEDGGDVAEVESAAAASSEAAGGAGDAGSATSEAVAERRALREARAAPFREACAGVMAQVERLREAASSLHSSRQRMLAEGVLRRLETIEPMIEQAAAAAVTPGSAALEDLARGLGPPDAALGSTGTSSPDPTFVTRDRHRREIPRVP